MKKIIGILVLMTLMFSFLGCEAEEKEKVESSPIVLEETEEASIIDIEDIPPYSGESYISINDNVPFFTNEEMTEESFEEYAPLDSLGRCGVTLASIGTDIMPTEDRGSISDVYPTGWEQESYDNVSGGYLYNRSHLIGHQLTGEDANEENLITGTRHMNVEMITFENMVADYVTETGNNVYYRVTPIFDGDNLLATGVLMEAKSVYDDGEDICFNVFIYNVQPGIDIDYATGESKSSNEIDEEPAVSSEKVTYVLNTNSQKIHLPNCYSINTMSEENKEEVTESMDSLLSRGYEPCGNCNP